jgi:hypothetical protein
MSAPAITKLALGSLFLRGQTLPPNLAFLNPRRTPIGNDITPLVEWAPCLEHLSFAMESPLARSNASQFVDRAFGSRWLDLKSPASIVREVTFVSSNPTKPIDVVAEHADRSLLISEARKFVKDEVVVGLEEEGSVEVQRAVWGW